MQLAKNYNVLIRIANKIWHAYLKDKKKLLFGTLIFLLLSRVSTVYLPFIYGKIIDSIQNKYIGSIHWTLKLIIYYGILRVFITILQYFQQLSYAQLAEGFLSRFSLEVMEKIVNLPPQKFYQESPGAIAQSILIGVRAIHTLLFSVLFQILPIICELFFILLVLISLFKYKYLFFLVVFIYLYIKLVNSLSQARLKYVVQFNSQEKDISGNTIDFLTNFEHYITNLTQSLIRLKYKNLYEKRKNLSIISQKYIAKLTSFQNLASCIFLVIFFVSSIYDLRANNISMGEFVMLIAYLNQIFSPLEQLGLENDQLQQSLTDAENLFQLEEEFLETSSDNYNEYTLKKLRGDISLRKVSYAYGDSSDILKDITYNFKVNTTTVIIGAVGSGKTTLLKLLTKLLPLNNGSIYIDKKNITQICSQALWQSVGIVPYNPNIFNGNVYFNVACQIHIDEHRVKKICKEVGLESLIASWPKGYNTILGNGGLQLSNGQRKKLALGRVLYKNPSIVIMDEPSSGLDENTEMQFIKTISKLKENRTLIIASHSKNIMAIADNVLELSQGRLKKIGTETIKA